MLKYKIKTLLLVVLIFIVSCTVTNRDKTPTQFNPYQGTDGLVMTFLQNNPPNEVYEDSEFHLAVKLENKGADNIKEGYLSLATEKDYIESSDWQFNKYGQSENLITFALEGKSKQRQKGEFGIASVNLKSKNLESQSETHTVLNAVTACYKYQTTFSDSVCIDSDIYNINPSQKACKVTDLSASSQGAPIAITKVEVKMLVQDNQVRPQFLIYIDNRGKGLVVEDENVKKLCSSEDSIVDIKSLLNIVKVEKAMLSNTVELKCEGQDNQPKIRLTGKNDFIRCEVEDSIPSGNYNTPLNIVLSYGYTETISKETIIRKIP